MIINKYRDFGLNLDKLLGQEYDGCCAMARKEDDVQAKIQSAYPKAAFVHCFSHRLNLVVSDLNTVASVHNSSGTIKLIITFFLESPKRGSWYQIFLPCLKHARLAKIKALEHSLRILKTFTLS